MALGNPRYFGENVLSVKRDDGSFIKRFTPHEGQLRLINANKRINLCTAGNRAGKTWAITLKHIYYAMYKIGKNQLLTENPQAWEQTKYQTLNGSYEYNVAQKIFNNISELSRSNPLFKVGGPFIKRLSQKDLTVVWFNNAETHCASLEERGKHVEGEGYDYVSIDEVGYIPGLEDIYNVVLLPRTLDTGGPIDLVGTPKEIQSGWIDEIAERSKIEDHINYITIPTSDNFKGKGGYLNKKTIETLQDALKDYPREYQMVFEGKLIPSSGKSLTAPQIQNSIDHDLPNDPRDKNGEPVKSKPFMFGTQTKIEGHRYVTFWDIAMQEDWSVGITLDVQSVPFQVVNYTRVNRSVISGWNELFDLMRREYERYGSPQFYDATGQIGGRLKEDLDKIAFENGFPTSWAKPMMIISDKGAKKSGKIGKEELINCLTLGFSFREPVEGQEKVKSWGKVRIPNIRQLVKELQGYHPDDKKIKETDSVIALAGCLAVAPDPERQKPRAGYFKPSNPVLEGARSYFRI